MPDFLVHARWLDTQPYPPFVVAAVNEAAARKVAQRDWLMLEAVQPYSPSADEPAPERLTYGPPLKDPRFDRDLAKADAEPPHPSGLSGEERAAMTIAGLLFGWVIWWND